MKKIFTFLCCICILFTAQARQHTIGDSLVRCTVIGELPTLAGQSIEFDIEGLLSDSSFEIKADRQGRFTFTLQFQWLYRVIFPTDSVDICSFSVLHNDTIRLHQTKSKVRVTTKNLGRDELINTANENANRWYLKRGDRLDTILNDTLLNTSEKVKKINDCYNEQVAELLAAGPFPAVASELVTEYYYYYLNMLNYLAAVPRFGLHTVIPSSYNHSASLKVPEPFDYSHTDLPLFFRCSQYRVFLLNYTNNAWTLFSSTRRSDDFPESEPERDYYALYYLISNPVMREWALFITLRDGLRHQNVIPLDSVYHHYLRKARSPLTRRLLREQYEISSRLTVQNVAPDFTLPGIDGRLVSLSQFKGKAVYINFWGVDCGPCISSIRKNYPTMVEHYKNQEVVFLNICVDAKEKEWKASIAELKFGGIHLLAEGWTRNPVCRLYNIYGIPRYILIDKEGKIGSFNIYPHVVFDNLKKYPTLNSFRGRTAD